ncbi:MAG: DUF2924 domain-containing protein, partial [Albidovulum sp.]
MSPLPTIAALEAMERAELLAAWAAIFGGPAPRSISRPLLRRFLAVEIQARRSGGLTARK